MSTLVEQLSTYAATLRYEDVPAEVVRQAKRLIVDTVGCALGGYWSEPARIARDIASTVRSSEPVTLIGSGERTSVDLATFANGVMIRFLDFNANASRNAVFAAMLAARGMTGPSPVFEGVGGYFKAVTRKPFALAAMGRGATPYKIMECSIKRFPLGQYSQTVVEAALELRAQASRLQPEEIRFFCCRRDACATSALITHPTK